MISERTMVGNSTQQAWFPIDTYPSVARHGKTSFRLTLTNGTEGTADVRLLVYDEDGTLLEPLLSDIYLRVDRQSFSHVDLADRGLFQGQHPSRK